MCAIHEHHVLLSRCGPATAQTTTMRPISPSIRSDEVWSECTQNESNTIRQFAKQLNQRNFVKYNLRPFFEDTHSQRTERGKHILLLSFISIVFIIMIRFISFERCIISFFFPFASFCFSFFISLCDGVMHGHLNSLLMPRSQSSGSI